MAARSIYPTVQLIPVDFSSDTESSLLRAQRVICTWSYDDIPIWAKWSATGERLMYWICIPATSLPIPYAGETSGLGTVTRPGASPPGLLAVGHIALDKVDRPTGTQLFTSSELASGDGRVVLLSSLFVHPQYAHGGLGRFAIRRCEELARVGLRWGTGPPCTDFPPPATATEADDDQGAVVECHTMTLHTLHPKHCLGGEPGSEGMGMFERMGIGVQEHNNVAWFERMGYVCFHEEPRYKVELSDGEWGMLCCIFMRKRLDDV